LFAHYFRYIDPYVFDPMLTFTIWVMVILGGPANNLGSIMGAALVESLERGARIVKDYLPLPFDVHNVRIIMIGLLMILVVMYKPEGLLRESRVRTPASEVAG
ncbi:TPA: branched-chain amino acid ABC transporter permease, partial [Candidatus Bathyarchaeota archaeon]|nr:branched-chain amino acid ABC transporter permease [Candidatus Bathyarchaeota archaeon]